MSLGGWSVTVPYFGRSARIYRTTSGQISMESIPSGNWELEAAEQLSEALNIMSAQIRERAGL